MKKTNEKSNEKKLMCVFSNNGLYVFYFDYSFRNILFFLKEQNQMNLMKDF